MALRLQLVVMAELGPTPLAAIAEAIIYHLTAEEGEI